VTAAVVGATLLAIAGPACKGPDTTITDAVKERLADEPTPMVQLDVSTRGRIVTLSGVVATEAERQRLERIVRDMDDVLGVDNRLTIQRPVEVTGSPDAGGSAR
jgi:hypothetical protein